MIKRRGTSILEVVIAAAMISVAVIAALSLTSKSQSNSDYARRTAQASKYGSELADWLKSQRDTYGFAELAARSGTHCVASLPADLVALSSLPSDCDNALIDSLYTRTVTLAPQADKVTATIVISWEEKDTRSQTIVLELAKW